MQYIAQIKIVSRSFVPRTRRRLPGTARRRRVSRRAGRAFAASRRCSHAHSRGPAGTRRNRGSLARAFAGSREPAHRIPATRHKSRSRDRASPRRHASRRAEPAAQGYSRAGRGAPHSPWSGFRGGAWPGPAGSPSPFARRRLHRRYPPTPSRNSSMTLMTRRRFSSVRVFSVRVRACSARSLAAAWNWTRARAMRQARRRHQAEHRDRDRRRQPRVAAAPPPGPLRRPRPAAPRSARPPGTAAGPRPARSAEAYRRAGSFCRHFRQIVSRSRGRPGHQPRRRHRLGRLDLLERLQHRRPPERRPAGQQLVEDRPQGVDVGRRADASRDLPSACSGAM